MKKVWKLLSYVLVAALASTATLFLYNSESKLEELENLIDRCFIGEADLTACEDAAAEAMIYALNDRWSYYIPANEFQTHTEQMENAYVGIGITIALTEDGAGFEIRKVNEGGPAAEAGLLAGDVIVKIAGETCAGMDTAQARNLVRGKENTPVMLTVRRDGAETDVEVIRKQVLVAVAVGELLEDSVGLITIDNFDERCADETIGAIEALLEQGAQALIFDVRFNPGGYKSELVEVLDYLLPAGPLFRSEDYRGNVTVDESGESCLEIPMAVLVNADSYSAAEFFAAALREYEAAVVVGEPTSGKGYFQNTYKLSDGSAAVLSIGKYTTPNGVSLAGVGIAPDVIVKTDAETAASIYAGSLSAQEDPQIQAAVEALKNP